MAIVERLEYDEVFLLEIVTNPILFAEFENNFDNKNMDWELTPYQKEFIGDFNNFISIKCGRATGKTVALTEIILWIMVNNIFEGDYIVYTVPNKVHLEPVFNNLIIKLRGNLFLRNFIDPRKGINASSYTVRLLNGSVLDCRIAGQSGTGANVIGIHTPFIILDESGYYPWGTWIELLPTLNTWTTGFRLIVSGVPTGVRENNVLYYADEIDTKFSKHHVSALENPRYTEEDDIRNIQQYGGKDSEDYIHLVLGEHGSPIFSVFDRRMFQLDVYPVYKLTLNGKELESNLSLYFNKLNLLPVSPDDIKGTIVGVDLGYTDPTAIVVLNLLKNGLFKFHARIQLLKVPYPIQEKIIDYIDTKYKPMVLGIDEGNVGKSTIHHLLEDTEFIHKSYNKRLIPVNFGATVQVGINTNGESVEEKVRPYSISMLQQYSNDHRIVYSTTDLEMVAELERMAYSKNPSGDVVYKTLTPKGGVKGEDHFTSALLSAILAYHITKELSILARPKKLFTATWLGV